MMPNCARALDYQIVAVVAAVVPAVAPVSAQAGADAVAVGYWDTTLEVVWDRLWSTQKLPDQTDRHQWLTVDLAADLSCPDQLLIHAKHDLNYFRQSQVLDQLPFFQRHGLLLLLVTKVGRMPACVADSGLAGVAALLATWQRTACRTDRLLVQPQAQTEIEAALPVVVDQVDRDLHADHHQVRFDRADALETVEMGKRVYRSREDRRGFPYTSRGWEDRRIVSQTFHSIDCLSVTLSHNTEQTTAHCTTGMPTCGRACNIDEGAQM